MINNRVAEKIPVFRVFVEEASKILNALEFARSAVDYMVLLIPDLNEEITRGCSNLKT